MKGKIMKNKGFSYIEMLIVIIIFLVISIAALGLYLTYFVVIDNVTNTAIALSDVQQVVEEIRDIDPFTAANLIGFAGSFNGSSFNNLEQEQISISYDVSSDPYLIIVTATWVGLGNRAANVSLTTYMTQR